MRPRPSWATGTARRSRSGDSLRGAGAESRPELLQVFRADERGPDRHQRPPVLAQQHVEVFPPESGRPRGAGDLREVAGRPGASGAAGADVTEVVRPDDVRELGFQP